MTLDGGSKGPRKFPP